MKLPCLLVGGGTLTYICPMGDGVGGGTVTQFEPMRQAGGGSTWLCACCLTPGLGEGGGARQEVPLKGAAYPDDCFGYQEAKNSDGL